MIRPSIFCFFYVRLTWLSYQNSTSSVTGTTGRKNLSVLCILYFDHVFWWINSYAHLHATLTGGLSLSESPATCNWKWVLLSWTLIPWCDKMMDQRNQIISFIFTRCFLFTCASQKTHGFLVFIFHMTCFFFLLDWILGLNKFTLWKPFFFLYCEKNP